VDFAYGPDIAIASNAANPNNSVVAVSQMDYVTTDGGTRWTSRKIVNAPSYGHVADAAKAPTVSVRTTNSTNEMSSRTTITQTAFNLFAPPANYALGTLFTLAVLVVTIYLIRTRGARK